MLKNVVKFAETAERLMAIIYTNLEKSAKLDERKAVFKRLSEEERAHTAAMIDLLDVIPNNYQHYDYEKIFTGQADFLREASLIMDQICMSQDECVSDDQLERLMSLENSLSESLFLQLQFFATGEQQINIKNLAIASTRHEGLLRGILKK